MMADGWLQEAITLLQRGLGDCRAFKMIGYRQLKEHLQGGCSLEQALVSIKTDHRRYARRQMVWFRAVEELQWLETPVHLESIFERCSGFLTVGKYR
jgi:tRNA dimethylallyltransferase